jgi:hypothetical protein
VDRVPVLDVEKGAAPPEDLGGVIGLDADPLPEMDSPDPLFQPLEFHGLPIHNNSGGMAQAGRFGPDRAILD